MLGLWTNVISPSVISSAKFSRKIRRAASRTRVSNSNRVSFSPSATKTRDGVLQDFLLPLNVSAPYQICLRSVYSVRAPRYRLSVFHARCSQRQQAFGCALPTHTKPRECRSGLGKDMPEVTLETPTPLPEYLELHF